MHYLSSNSKGLLRLSLAGLFALGLAGCTKWSNTWSKILPEAAKSDKPLPGKPKLDVAGQNLGEAQELSIGTKEMLINVAALLDAQRFRSASRWIERHPDAALEALRQAGSLKGDPRSMLAIARVQDRQSLRAAAGPTWEQVLRNRGQAPQKFEKFDEARTQVQAMASQAKTDQALKINLTALAAATGEPLLEIDAWQLQGTALLLGNRHREAVAAWQKAIALAEPVSDYQTAYLRLLLSDAQRRAGDPAQAAETWKDAVSTAAGMISADRATFDPVLWERLSYMRPIELAWPDHVLRRLHEIDPIPGVELPPPGRMVSAQEVVSPAIADAILWNSIGKWYLDRGHHQAALVAFKRVESALTDPIMQQYMRIRQARALLLLDQTGAATAILVALAGDKNSPMSRPAMGVLGSIRLQSGNAQQGLNLLRKAVEKEDTPDFSDRAQAEADLGLAWLIIGDEAQGLKWIHQAQKRFESQGDFESLTLSLQNEAAYLAHAKKRNEAAAVRDRHTAMERE